MLGPASRAGAPADESQRLNRRRVTCGLSALALGGLLYSHLQADRVHAADSNRGAKPPSRKTAAKRPAGPVRTPAAPVVKEPAARVIVDPSKVTEAAADPRALPGLSLPHGGDVPWGEWTSLEGTAVSVSSSSADIPVYAARIPDGVVVLLVNGSRAKVNANLSVRLTRGLYSVERFEFGAGTSNPAGTALPRNRVERLQSALLTGAGSVGKPVWLAPGQAAIYRFTNRSAQTMAAFAAVKAAVRAGLADHPGPYGRILTPLHECESNVGALANGVRAEGRESSLKYIHRALLTVAHAQSLCQNFGGQGVLDVDRANSLMIALNRLEDQLTELSIGCLGLVPEISVAPADAAPPGTQTVTVSLRNAGKQPISNIKLGAGAPGSLRVEPSEQALFTSLAPGETVRAVYRVQLPEEAAVKSIVGEIAYFAARAPAHIRLRAF